MKRLTEPVLIASNAVPQMVSLYKTDNAFVSKITGFWLNRMALTDVNSAHRQSFGEAQEKFLLSSAASATEKEGFTRIWAMTFHSSAMSVPMDTRLLVTFASWRTTSTLIPRFKRIIDLKMLARCITRPLSNISVSKQWQVALSSRTHSSVK